MSKENCVLKLIEEIILYMMHGKKKNIKSLSIVKTLAQLTRKISQTL